MASVVVTSFSAEGARLYGRRMVQTYLEHWPVVKVPLVVYLDAPVRPALPVEERWTKDIAEWVACMERWAPHPSLHGQSTPEVPLNKPYKYQWAARDTRLMRLVLEAERLDPAEGVAEPAVGQPRTTAQ
jgi:hypothetical protein